MPSNLKEHIDGMKENILGALYDLEGGAADVWMTMNDIKGYMAALIAKIREGEEKEVLENVATPLGRGWNNAKLQSITTLKEAEELLK